jgi:hypothetical protein
MTSADGPRIRGLAMLDERRRDVFQFAFAAGAGADVAFGSWTCLAATLALATAPAGLAFGLFAWTLLRLISACVGSWCVTAPERARAPAVFLVLARIAHIAILPGIPGNQGDVIACLAIPTTIEAALLVPLALFLLEGSALAVRLRAAIPFLAAAVHALAALAMLLVIAPAADPGIPIRARLDWFEGHLALWRAGWLSWMLGAVSLLAYYAWWGAHLPSRNAARAAFGLTCLGACFDLSCEARLLVADRSSFVEALRSAGFWTTVFANGFYCIAGVILTVATRGLPRWLNAWSWAIWIVGFGMSAAGAANWLLGIKITTGLITVLLVPWFVVMGRFLKRGAAPA